MADVQAASLVVDVVCLEPDDFCKAGAAVCEGDKQGIGWPSHCWVCYAPGRTALLSQHERPAAFGLPHRSFLRVGDTRLLWELLDAAPWARCAYTGTSRWRVGTRSEAASKASSGPC